MGTLRIPDIPDHFNCVTIDVTSLSGQGEVSRRQGRRDATRRSDNEEDCKI